MKLQPKPTAEKACNTEKVSRGFKERARNGVSAHVLLEDGNNVEELKQYSPELLKSNSSKSNKSLISFGGS